VCFPTRILNGSVSAIDNIFVDFSRKGNYTISSLVNGLSDHDGQLIRMKNINLQTSSSSHVDWLMSKLGSACYAVRAIKPCMAQGTLRLIYFSYFHSVMTYGLVFWDNSPHSIHIFRLQKRAIRIITNSGSRESCRELFKKMEILPLLSQFIFSLLLFIVNNKDQFRSNSEI
jgi:hypothetical protein